MKVVMMLGLTRIEADGDIKECFQELSAAAEVFGQSECKACGSKEVVPMCREHDGNTFYEMGCQKCGCTLGFGQRKSDGKLFPRRKNTQTGQWIQNEGWQDWRANRQPAESAF